MELKSYFAQDSQGNVLPGATCQVYLAGTTTLATGLRDANSEPKSNPFTAASNGLVQFAAPNGVYDLAVSSGGANYTLRVQCNDVNDSIAAVQDAAGQAEAAADRAEQAGDAAESAADRAETAASLAAGFSESTNLLTKNLFGRLTAAGPLGAPQTTQCIMELETEFLGLRLGIPNIHTAAVAGIRVCVALVNQAITQAWLIDNAPTTGWVDVTFSGNTSVTLPARLGADRPSFTWSDPIELQSLPRTDGGTRPLVMVRIEVPQGGYRSQPANGISNWRQNTSPRYFKAATQDVLGVTTKSSYTNTLNTEVGVMIPAVQYMTEKQGKQLLISGDSTVEGVGGNPICYAAAQKVAYEASTPANPVEYFNAAIHAQLPAIYHQRIAELVDVVLPTNLVYSPFSSNDALAGGITNDAIARLKLALGNVLAACRRASVQPEITLLEGLPNTTAYRSYGTNDSKRVALNTWFSTLTGVRSAEGYAAAVSGATVDGQVQLAPEYHNDGVHPNAAGYAALADALRPHISL